MHFQSTMQTAFADLINDHLLVYVDDVVLYAGSHEEYLEVLQRFFARLRELNLKLNLKKSTIYQDAVSWCGKIIDGQGVTHDPARVEALTSLPLPENAGELQHFLCAANWLRDSVVDFGRAVAPLQAKFDDVMKGHSRRKRHAASVAISWSDDEVAAYQAFMQRLGSSAKLSFADDEAVVGLSTDASDRGWAVILTQVRCWKDGVPVHEQSLELLMCKGGSFKGSQLQWSVVEKEAYPVVYAVSELDYLLQRLLGFRIYTDHANLIQIFCPSAELKKHVRGKLQRWAMKLAGSRYTIEHVNGEDNHWADLVSRWPVRENIETLVKVKAVRTRSHREPSPLRPLQDEAFEWPSLEAVATAQSHHNRARPSGADERDGLVYVDEKLWIPRQEKDLLLRILVVAHCGIQRHRGIDAMTTQLEKRFAIESLSAVISRFVNGCLLCKHIKGGKLIQRPWSETETATKRNEVLHMDYLTMGEAYGTTKYVLVLKNELTHYCELVACDAPTSDVAVVAILDWHKRFGFPAKWSTDNGSHFRSAVMAELATRLRGLQICVPVYTPWINGTVERINRNILQVVRALLLELRLDTRSWEYLLPVVQANLKQTPVVSLGNKSPMELFTGLPASTPLDTCLLPDRGEPLQEVDLGNVEDFLNRLREGLHTMHMDVVDRKERRRLYQQAHKKGTTCNFSVGDFVLWSRIDTRLGEGKLLVRWVGPFEVVEAKSHSFMVRHVLTQALHEVHGSRLKYYHDPSLEVNEELVSHVASQGLVLGVERILNHRFNNTTRRHELLVSWIGLESIEDSWEPLSVMLADVPVKVKEYASHQDDTELRNLCGVEVQ
ncbi:hypothetical protein PF005_g26671 [Phytophthora fragariae]|uniref:Integrase catalytic domain-containing protein n=2 Tax=Phytophthora fragariae TaxID=53985 RepID=A0A6A3DSS5_9STRA|nr:hypothetical protein PF003_g34368 [Phytophthora fragariae]KAE8922231.1 hypothetical protein PF009_g27501 [Phytophthora fragariae]KAE9070229.1 hypothetical protein PF010_g26362 [Phytophthora fragariae]KAE9172527.1 hypothetical protein PF005_g26671 [Phytophthora fragariae]KAE9276269.1 hypothetical protein PF001_g26208 [Phytophthora fragariae]